MSDDSLLFTDKDDVNDLHASSNAIHQSIEHNEEEEKQQGQINRSSERSLTQNDVCYYSCYYY